MELKIKNSEILQELRQLPLGRAYEILPNTLLVKGQRFQHRYANMYILADENRREILLIDAVRIEAKQPVLDLMQKGYKVRGIILTHNHLVGQAFSNMQTVSETFGGTPLFMHPADISPYISMMRSVVDEEHAMQDFGLEVIHMEGHTYGSVSIYSKMNGGTLFCGDNAIGSPYDMDTYYFERPKTRSSRTDAKLARIWKELGHRVSNLLPLHGKPEMYITEKRYAEIKNGLDKPNEFLAL